MKTLWRVRPSYFTRPGAYTFEVDGDKIEFTADREGFFQFMGEPSGGLGIFASRIDDEKQTVVIGKIFEPIVGTIN